MRKSIPMFDSTKTPARRPRASSQTHRNEFPAGYSLASCSPAELASAFPRQHDFATIKVARRANISGRFVSNFGAVSKRTAAHSKDKGDFRAANVETLVAALKKGAAEAP